MTDLEPPGDAGSETAELAAAMACRPRRRDDVVATEIDGSFILWPPSAPRLISGIAAAVWPHLDGRSSLGELAEDLAAVTGVPLAEARLELSIFGAELAANGLADGFDEVAALVADEPGPDRVDRIEVRDGVTYAVTEFTIRTQEVLAATGGRASAAELLPPDSCAGRRLQLDRPASSIPVTIGDHTLRVRSADPEVSAWLEEHAAPEGAAGPTVAFVTVDNPKEPRRFVVYDRDGLLLTTTSDRSRAQEAVAAALLDNLPLDIPDGYHELQGRILAVGGNALVTSTAALTRPRGLQRQLARQGVMVLPTRRSFITEEADHVLVPRLADLADPSTVRWDRWALAAGWAAGNQPGKPDHPQLVYLLIKDTLGGSAESRRALVRGVDSLVRRRPVFVTDRTNRSIPAMASGIRAALEAPLS